MSLSRSSRKPRSVIHACRKRRPHGDFKSSSPTAACELCPQTSPRPCFGEWSRRPGAKSSTANSGAAPLVTATLQLRLPPRLVLALPELHRAGIVEDVPVLRVALQRPAGPVGDVAQVTQERRPVALGDLAV